MDLNFISFHRRMTIAYDSYDGSDRSSSLLVIFNFLDHGQSLETIYSKQLSIYRQLLLFLILVFVQSLTLQ